MGYVPVHPVPAQVPLVVSSGPSVAESVAAVPKSVMVPVAVGLLTGR